MIRVTVELLPGGVDLGQYQNEILGVMFLSNDVHTTATTRGKRGTYLVELWKKRNAARVHAGASDVLPWGAFKVHDFPRLSLHPWNLVLRALQTAADRNGGNI